MISFQPGVNPRKSVPISCTLLWRQNSRRSLGALGQLTASLVGLEVSLPPISQDLRRLPPTLHSGQKPQPAGKSGATPYPPPSLYPNLQRYCVSIKKVTPLSGAPEKGQLGNLFFLKKKTNLVGFSLNIYISQFWLIHSSKSKSSSILHPFLTVQMGTSIPIPISSLGRAGVEEGAFPRRGPHCWSWVPGFRSGGLGSGWASEMQKAYDD